jgi:bifunctional non-homologous end joining protein LigD
VAWSCELVARHKKALGAKASWAGFIEPALAASIDKVPGGSRWIPEIKFDGYRFISTMAR